MCVCVCGLKRLKIEKTLEELAPIFEDIKKNGMEAAMKYYQDEAMAHAVVVFGGVGFWKGKVEGFLGEISQKVVNTIPMFCFFRYNQIYFRISYQSPSFLASWGRNGSRWEEKLPNKRFAPHFDRTPKKRKCIEQEVMQGLPDFKCFSGRFGKSPK